MDNFIFVLVTALLFIDTNEVTVEILREINLDKHQIKDFYTIPFSIGTIPEENTINYTIQNFTIQVDTTSSITWIPSNKTNNNHNISKYNSSLSYSSIETNDTICVVDEDGDDRIESQVKNTSISLQSWQKDIYEIIDNKLQEKFNLQDIYKYEEKLQQLHPQNNNIKAKIRQILQQLRDKGLIKFEEPGCYKKIFK